MSIIKRRITHKVKPQRLFKLDSTNKTAKKFSCYHLMQHGMRDQVSLNALTPLNILFNFPTVNEHGQVMEVVDTGGSSTSTFADNSFLDTDGAFTILTRVSLDANSLAGNTSWFVSNGASGDIILRSTGATTGMEIIVNQLTGSDRTSHSMTLANGGDFFVACSWAGTGTPIKLYTWDIATGRATSESGNASLGSVTINSCVVGNNSFDGAFHYFIAAKEALTDNEIWNIYENPYRYLQPMEQRVFIPAAAVGGTTLPPGSLSLMGVGI